MDERKTGTRRKNIPEEKVYTLNTEGASVLPSSQVTLVHNIYINKCDTAIIGENTLSSSGQTSSDGNTPRNDKLVAITNDTRSESGQSAVPLFCLEQDVCEKLRKTKNSNLPNFQEFCGLTFKQFLERNCSHFDIKHTGSTFMVSKVTKKKRKKKKKKERKTAYDQTVTEAETSSCDIEQDSRSSAKVKATTFEFLTIDQKLEDYPMSSEWQEARSKKELRKSSKEIKSVVAKGEPSLQHEDNKNDFDKTDEGLAKYSTDESFINGLLMKPQDNLLLFRQSENIYTSDPIRFTLDVVSMWNTPYRIRAHIVLGVKPKATPPHVIKGLETNKDDAFYQSLFKRDIFDPKFIPKFSYREMTCRGKTAGIIQIESCQGTGFPCYVMNDDIAPRLQKDQLWVRKGTQNEVVAPSDLLTAQIYAWFGCLQKSVENLQHTVRDPVSSSSEQHNLKETGNTVANSSAISAISPAKRLMVALSSFKKGHFVLMCGSLCVPGQNIEALGSAPWIIVYDFDFKGRDSGLLAYLEDTIKHKRSLSVSTWCDPVKGITEKGTQWWSLRGRRDVPESCISQESGKAWGQSVHNNLEKLCQELARFSEDYTVLTVLVLWPNSQLERECIQRFLIRLHEYMDPKVLLCFTDSKPNHAENIDVQMIVRNYSENVELFDVILSDLCSEIELTHGCSQNVKFKYDLPSSNNYGSKSALITEEDASWLTQDLEVLYLNSPFSKNAITTEGLKEEADNFFRGGTIGWYAWYELGSGFFDVERNIFKDITAHIRQIYLDKCKSGIVTIFHAPGSGGSTMAQRVLWDMHDRVPCVQVKQRSGSSLEEVAARLTFLHEKTQLPVVALLDGEDEPRLKQLLMHVQRNYIVILYVKRFPYPIHPNRPFELADSKFYLRGVVTKEESQKLVLRLGERCTTDEKIKALNRLDEDVQKNGVDHHMYEYGMTVYDHEFKGVRAFVKGYLQLTHGDLLTWQKCLGFLSLVFYYGQSSLPCQFFASLLGKPSNYKMDIGDLHFPIPIFVVPDSNEGRTDYIRIGHYIIAREILEQILNRSSQRTTDKVNSDMLSQEARRNLKQFCIEIISYAAKKRNRTSTTAQTITTILARTFIFRDNKEVVEMNQTTKKPLFSRIMTELDHVPPYNGRLDVLQKLCDTFPDDPNFRAHLGRFYACCRPEEEEKSEKHFDEALRLCNERGGGRELSQIEEGLKFTLMHVYHMYGIVFQRRISKLQSKPTHSSSGESADEFVLRRLDEIIDNAQRACLYFVKSRHYTPPGHADLYTFINEINVRLQVCDFVKKNFDGGISEFMSKSLEDPRYKFIQQSATEVDDLIKECYSVVLLDINDRSLQTAWNLFNDIFQTCSPQLEVMGKSNDVMSRRQLIMAKKLEFPRSASIFSVESNVPADKIEGFVRLLENLFQHENVYRDSPKSKLELDYKDWMIAIRNPNFKKVYSLENVLEHVRHWHDSVRSPMSTFYVFVLLSLLGFGSNSQTGHTESLVEAQTMREDMQKFSKMVIRPRFPREWLGREDLPGIHRMVSSASVGHVEDRYITGSRAKLSVCKGTIRPKNKKLAGSIDLDLGENRTPVHVFFVPLLANLEGVRYSGVRVQFHIAFNLERGYEAYEVKVLEKYKCSVCHLKVEMRQDDSEVICIGCNNVIVKNEHTHVPQPTATPSNEDDD